LVIKKFCPVQFVSELTYFRDIFREKAEFLETGLYLLHYNARLKYQPQTSLALSRATILSILQNRMLWNHNSTEYTCHKHQKFLSDRLREQATQVTTDSFLPTQLTAQITNRSLCRYLSRVSK